MTSKLYKCFFSAGGAFGQADANPFSKEFGEGAMAGADEAGTWIVEERMAEYDEIFQTCSPRDGKISGSNAKKVSVVEFQADI